MCQALSSTIDSDLSSRCIKRDVAYTRIHARSHRDEKVWEWSVVVVVTVVVVVIVVVCPPLSTFLYFGHATSIVLIQGSYVHSRPRRYRYSCTVWPCNFFPNERVQPGSPKPSVKLDEIESSTINGIYQTGGKEDPRGRNDSAVNMCTSSFVGSLCTINWIRAHVYWPVVRVSFYLPVRFFSRFDLARLSLPCLPRLLPIVRVSRWIVPFQLSSRTFI